MTRVVGWRGYGNKNILSSDTLTDGVLYSWAWSYTAQEKESTYVIAMALRWQRAPESG